GGEPGERSERPALGPLSDLIHVWGTETSKLRQFNPWRLRRGPGGLRPFPDCFLPNSKAGVGCIQGVLLAGLVAIEGKEDASDQNGLHDRMHEGDGMRKSRMMVMAMASAAALTLATSVNASVSYSTTASTYTQNF